VPIELIAFWIVQSCGKGELFPCQKNGSHELPYIASVIPLSHGADAKTVVTHIPHPQLSHCPFGDRIKGN
jgi:hypothetical protein